MLSSNLPSSILARSRQQIKVQQEKARSRPVMQDTTLLLAEPAAKSTRTYNVTNIMHDTLLAL